MFKRFGMLLALSRYHHIGRRYFVVNGFDGALTMLGILIGFYHASNIPVDAIINACLGAAVALGVSGFSSAYISETAERQKDLKELESAMMTNLDDTAHAYAAKISPAIIALINGLSPLLLSLIIMMPLWVSPDLYLAYGIDKLLSPIDLSIIFALITIFFLGIFLGKVSGQFWLISGLRTLLIAIVTGVIILFITP